MTSRLFGFDFPAREAYARWLLGESWAKQDAPDLDRAEQHYRKGLAAAERLGMRLLAGHCHWGLGSLAGRKGDVEGARGALDAARDLFGEMEMSFWLRQLETVVREA